METHDLWKPLHHTSKSLCSLIMTQIFPVLLYLAQTSLQRNKPCLLLALKDLPVRFILSKAAHCSLLYGGIDCKVKSQLQVILKPAEFLTAKNAPQKKNMRRISPACPLIKWNDVTLRSWLLFLKLCMIVQCGIFCSKSYKIPPRPLKHRGS